MATYKGQGGQFRCNKDCNEFEFSEWRSFLSFNNKLRLIGIYQCNDSCIDPLFCTVQQYFTWFFQIGCKNRFSLSSEKILKLFTLTKVRANNTPHILSKLYSFWDGNDY